MDLRENDEWFRNIFIASAAGMATFAPQGQFLTANPAYCRMLGYTQDELRFYTSASLTHPADLPANLALRNEIRDGVRDSYVLENRYLKKNGDIVWTLDSTSAAHNASGEVTMFIVIAEDITEHKRVEDQLKWKSAFLEAQVNAALDGILVIDKNGMKISQNQRFIDLWNIPKEIADEADHRRRFAWIKSQIKNPEPFATRVAYLYEHPDESSRDELELISGKFIERYSTSVKDSDGNYYGRIWIYHDITDQKRGEKRFKRLADSNAQAIFFWNTSGGITESNDAFLKLTGYTREDLKAGLIDWAAMTPPEYAHLDQSALKQLAATSICAPYEKEFIRKDSARVPIILGAAMFEDNPDEGICYVLDLTERKRDEALLYLRDRAINAVSQAIIITDVKMPDNTIVYVSPSFEQLTGYSSKEAIGRNCRFLQGKNTDPQTLKEIREAIQEERACTVELINYRKDGTYFWNNLALSPVRDQSGKLVNYVGVQTDVTQRRELEEQLHQSQKMEAIGLLAGGIAHDFNNLLTVINGYSEVIINMLPPNDPSQRFLGFIKEAGEQSEALTTQLLAFSKNQFLSPKVIT